MAELKKSLLADLKQLAWALFLIYLILAVTGDLFGKQIGYGDAFAACMSVAALVTLSFASIYILNLVWIAVERKKEERLNSRKGS